LNWSSAPCRITRLWKQSLDSKAMSVRRPLKLLLVMGIFLFFGLYRLRYLLILFDLPGYYSGYLSGYVANAVLGYNVAFLTYDTYLNAAVTFVSIEIGIALIVVLAVYSTLALRRSYLAKIGCFALIIAGITVYSDYPIIESVVGVLCFLILIQRDIKEIYAQKEGRYNGKAIGGRDEVTFRADLSSPREKQRAGKKCPKCGLLLPPSAKVCRRCKTRLAD
jgi:hypothetical protein